MLNANDLQSLLANATVNAVIRLDLRLPTSRAQEKLERDEAVREVRRAVQAWYYETYC